MATKLERLERLRPIKDPYQNSDYKPYNLPISTLEAPKITPINPLPKSTIN